ncbi:VTT domain-containing protein [Sedimentitalea sp. JM2-8]|uniref:TVP38/TMEM64 family membrane protein n=1 Tax=Sedimentitalea xiamensis TaxID=3050037 RepID=A0ABT7FED5_9RHOB|nr:VTT domain-containing protein [Sedimentitalea xiamensis]MDK3073452.1 VTT domain-containing protein [Sedimentitalea xiamensis]
MTVMPDTPNRGFSRHIPLIVMLVVAVIGGLTLRDHISFETLRQNRESLLTFRDQNLPGMAAVFLLAYVTVVAFSLPGAAIASITGGFLFGLGLGVCLNVTAATIGACLIFLAAQLGIGAVVSARLETSEGKLKRLKDGLRENEISILLLLRLVPAVPFFVANLLPALVGVKFGNFVWTTALGIVPGAIVFTWIGVGLGEVFDRGETPDLSLLWEPQILGPMLGLCGLAALPMVVRVLRDRNGI